mmetsp:Transcript_37681/g.111527  ORF Transcript_37681/g.111527 Transcript_37681/m.111527 type:complete len:283 (-) Transcript_37681:3006-3854(-)
MGSPEVVAVRPLATRSAMRSAAPDRREPPSAPQRPPLCSCAPHSACCMVRTLPTRARRRHRRAQQRCHGLVLPRLGRLQRCTAPRVGQQHRRAGVEQRRRCRRVSGDRRDVQQRAVRKVDHADVRAGLQQVGQQRRVAAHDARNDGRQDNMVAVRQARARVLEHARHICVPVEQRQAQRRVAVTVAELRGGLQRQQQLDNVGAASMRRHHQHGAARLVDRVDVDALLQHLEEEVVLAGGCGAEHVEEALLVLLFAKAVKGLVHGVKVADPVLLLGVEQRFEL